MHVKTVAKYIRRSPYQAILAANIMTLTFFVISGFAVISLISIKVINFFGTKPQVTVFFKDNVKQEDIFVIKQKIEQTGQTASVKYVSQEEALSIYKKLNQGDDPLLNDLVTPNALPQSLEIQATQAQYLTDLANMVKGDPRVDKIMFQKEIIDRFISFTNAIKDIGLVIIAVLITESVFVILTIISIKITIRREEIETMKLIGATNWFIRSPFIMEGMFYGLVGSVIGWASSYAILLYFQPTLRSYFQGLPIFPMEPSVMLALLGIEVIIAVVLGAFSSFLAVLRYLK